MMRLHDAARRFDKSVLTDAYTDAVVGKGQLDPTDIFKLDGASVRRRVISVSPSVTIPDRRAIKLGVDTYLVGEPSTDETFGTPIRVKYVLHNTPGIATVKTIEEALASDAGFTAWASREWNKDISYSQESSEYINDYHIFFGKNENLSAGDLILVDGHWHYCHAVHPSLSGFNDAVSHELPGTVFETVLAISKTYNPITDSYTTLTDSIPIIRFKWQENFKYFTVGTAEYVRGDETIVALDIDWPDAKASDSITMSDGVWNVICVVDLGTTRRLHVRRA